jgi:hypothetical protein
MANGITYAGLTLSVSAAIPATYDAVGFAALTYTAVGEVSSVGDRGQTYEDVTFTTLADRATKHLKGTSDQPETAIELIINRADAGQVLLKAASDSDAQYAFKIEYNNGEVDYFQALVYSFMTVGGDSNTVRTGTVNVRLDSRDAVEVAAP